MNTAYRFGRRRFLSGVGTSSLGLWLRGAEARAAGEGPPQRLLLMFRPNGNIPSLWTPTGGETDFALPMSSAPFAPLRDHMVIFKNLDIVLEGRGSRTHEGGRIAILTGGGTDGYRPAPNDWINTHPSIDQHLLAHAPDLKQRKPLHLAATSFVGPKTNQVANRAVGYTGVDQPIFPELDPTLVYQRVFGSLMPGGATPDNRAALARAQLRRKSVLDFLAADMTRLRSLVSVDERPRLEQHAAAIRELEQALEGDEPLVPAAAAWAWAPGRSGWRG